MTITRVRLPDYPERPSGGRRDPCAGEPAEYGLWDLYRKDAGRGGIKNGGKCRSLASVSSINNRKAKNFAGLQTFRFDIRRASFQKDQLLVAVCPDPSSAGGAFLLPHIPINEAGIFLKFPCRHVHGIERLKAMTPFQEEYRCHVA